MSEAIQAEALNTLKQYGVLSDTNKIDTNVINVITGKHAPELVAAIIDKHGQQDMISSYRSLNDYHVKQQFDDLKDCLNTQYNISGLDMPTEISAILDYGDGDLLEVFFYEFLSDIHEEMEDLFEE